MCIGFVCKVCFFCNLVMVQDLLLVCFFFNSVISFLGIIFSLKLCISMVSYDSFQSNFAVLLVLVFGWQLLYLDAKHKSAVEVVCVLERIEVGGGYQGGV